MLCVIAVILHILMNVNCKILFVKTEEIENFRCEEDIATITRIPDNEVIIYVEDSVGAPIYRPGHMEQI